MNFKDLAKAAKTDVCDHVSDDAISTIQAELTLEAALQTIMLSVSRGESVKLRGFGTFERRQYDERDMSNPKTGERETLAARHVVKFIPCEAFKNAVKGNLL